MVAQHAPQFAVATDVVRWQAQFEMARIVQVAGFLTKQALGRLQAEATAYRAKAERSYIPGHKKGGALSYEAVHRFAPACLALYHSAVLRHWLSGVVGEAVRPTADHDQSSCSLLYYDQTGDHIGWHYDLNFYRGRHFTVLLSLLNRAPGGGLSHGCLQRRHRDKVDVVNTEENSLVVFEGAEVLHRATAVGKNELRVILSMTFCTDPGVGRLRELARRIKDTAYYGPRVLFD